jgi:hypothetical protein
MAVTLPYHFNTAESYQTVVRGGVGVGLVVVIGLVYSALISHDYIVVLQLALIGAIAGFMTWVIGVRTRGSVGILSADGIIVERAPALFGQRLPGASGRFPLNRFSAVRVEEASGPVLPNVNWGPHTRIYLVGKTGVPDVLIARTTLIGGTEAAEFADLLSLPLQRVATGR